MTSKKYKIRKDLSRNLEFCTVYRIERISDGQLGGYVEKESNLSQNGQCWIAYDAVVCRDAEVRDNAYVSDNAYICGKPEIFGNAIISQNARIGGDAKIYGNASVYGHSYVGDEAQVFEHACVCGYAVILNSSRLYGTCIVRGNAQINGNAEIHGYAIIRGDIHIRDRANIHGDTILTGIGTIGENIHISDNNSVVLINPPGNYPIIVTKTHVVVGCKTYTRQRILKITRKEAEIDGMSSRFFTVYKSMILGAMKLMEVL